MKIKIKELRELMVGVLSSKYYSLDEANKIADVLLFGELTGKSTMGIVKLLGTEPHQNIKPKYPPKIVKETKLSALIDGGGVAGPLAAQIATDKLIEIAKSNGFGIVGTNNTFSSICALSYYARKIAQNDFIGVVTACSPRIIPHFGSTSASYGTNPIAFGFPTNSYPIVFDMASSAITWSGLVKAKALGKPLPENVAMDKDGNLTTDPSEAMGGSILPFDNSYKGSGLAMVIELLSGPLTGGGFVFDEGDWGSTFMAFSPDLLVGTKEFKGSSSELIEKVKSGKTRDGQSVRIPGYDREMELEESLKNGEVEIEEELIQKLQEMNGS